MNQVILDHNYLVYCRYDLLWQFSKPNTEFKLRRYNNNNNNNKAFKSQTSWGRLELKPSRSNQGSGTWIAVFQALLSKANSLDIFHPFTSPFIASTQVNFGLPLPLFTLLSCLKISLRTGASWDLRWICPNHLNRCWTSFSSIGAISNLSRILSFQTRSLLVWPQI